jgi:hypothetical protein
MDGDVADSCERSLSQKMQPLLPGLPILIRRVSWKVKSALGRRLGLEDLGDKIALVQV